MTLLSLIRVIGSAFVVAVICRPQFPGSSVRSHGAAFLAGFAAILGLHLIFSITDDVEQIIARGGWYGWSMFGGTLLLLCATLGHLIAAVLSACRR